MPPGWRARTRVRVAFRANNQVAQAIAARTGVGPAMLPHYIGRGEPELRLCRLDPVMPPREIWILTRRQDRKNLAIGAVVEHLMRRFADERSLFEA